MTFPTALLYSPEANRLIEISDTIVTLSFRETSHRFLHLPDSALRVLVHPSSLGASLTGWAVDESNLAPVPAVFLLQENGALIPSQRLSRPDIRATQELDHDMVGFSFDPPQTATVTLLFLLQEGVTVKSITLLD